MFSVSAGKSEVASIVTLTQPAALAAIASPVYRQPTAVAAVNLSQKLHPVSCATSGSQQQLVPGNISYSLAAAAVGLVRQNVATSVGLSVVRPVGVSTDAGGLARMVCDSFMDSECKCYSVFSE